MIKKTSIEIFKIAFLIIGTVIGAGFISGGEIVRFFSNVFLLPSIFLTCLLFYFVINLLLYLGSKYKDIDIVNRECFGGFGKFFKTILLLGSFIIISSMMAGIDSLFNDLLKFPKYLPIFSCVSVIIGHYLVKKGVNALSKVNSILVPLMIIVIIVLLLPKNHIELELKKDFDEKSVFLPFFYVAMNMFLASSVIISAGKTYNPKSFKLASLFATVILGFCIYLIITRLDFEKTNILAFEMPIIALFSNKLVLVVLGIVIYFGIFTTLISSIFPLYAWSEEKKNPKLTRFIMYDLIFLLSRFGLKNIIQFIYPLIGAIGGVYLIVGFFRCIKLKDNL